VAPRPDLRDDGQPFPFRHVEGEGIFEITVGPVHAGIIEPGHFRFSVEGETIVNLETRLGFVHKGTEKLFETLPFGRTWELAERVSGDTSVGHALAYCRALESLAGSEVPPRAAALRAVAAGEAVPTESAWRVAVRLTTPLWVGIGGVVALLVLWFLYLALTRP